MDITVEAIRKRTEEAERICVEDGCSDQLHFGPRRDIFKLLDEVKRLKEKVEDLASMLPWEERMKCLAEEGVVELTP